MSTTRDMDLEYRKADKRALKVLKTRSEKMKATVLRLNKNTTVITYHKNEFRESDYLQDLKAKLNND